MKVAILLGFEYRNCSNEDYLPGISIDLYLIHRIVQQIQPDETIVITDLDSDPDQVTLSKALLKKIVDMDVVDHVHRLKQQNIYCKYQGKDHLVETISQLLSRGDKVFFYYSGHGENGSLILPGGELLSTQDLGSLIGCTDREALLIVDCCHGDGFRLPYNYRPRRYQLVNQNFVLGKIICLSSTSQNQKTMATKLGSKFTRTVTEQLVQKVQAIQTLNTQIPEVNICSSYPNLDRIWNWVVGSKLSILLDSNCAFRIHRY